MTLIDHTPEYDNDKPVRFGPEDWERVTGLKLCDHITIPNAYHPRHGNAEYHSGIQIRCEVCEETYNITELIN